MFKCSQCEDNGLGHFLAPCRHEGAELATVDYRRELQHHGDIATAEKYPSVWHCPCCGADQDPETGEWFWPRGYRGLPDWPREGHIWEDGQWVFFPEELIWRDSLRKFLSGPKYLESHYVQLSGRGLHRSWDNKVIQPPRRWGAAGDDADAYLWGIVHGFYEGRGDDPAPCVIEGHLTNEYINNQCRKIGIDPVS